MSISSINLNTFSMKDSLPSNASSTSNSFANTLNQALGNVNQSQQVANQMVTQLANGDSNVDLHNVMLAMQKSNILLKTTVQVRDRVISAYEEVMRMQV
ncbi:flagellar hook-basal body complex protein FliE [Sporolactobacillus spathodeae]|uniref:Flagellar hook-basal body complex protein FliE n=1 Tax=Sporolactobacillus spathodeae TaxID=1465502 RepID=A0ABS2Q578_9BACL|nr:flagellar hook-basal body complex protein FliE [Sporolactobacillus spathodeae]MBM7656943.1 flagellar hook-basal body complex protein FliE [Sporolactobacillus spathodeae]